MEQIKYKVILDTDTFNEADDQFAISYLVGWFFSARKSYTIFGC